MSEVKVTERDEPLEAEVAARVMGWRSWRMRDGEVVLWEPQAAQWLPREGAVLTDEPWDRADTSMFKCSVDMNAVFRVEDRIKELGLEEEYGERLSEEIHRQSNGKHDIFYGSEVFDIAHASAELRCRVALECVKEKAKAAGG